MIRKRGFPFEVVSEEPNELTRRTIEESLAGKNVVGPFHNVKDLMDSLNA